MLKKFFLVVMMVLTSEGASRADIIFSENMGTPTGTTTIASNTFQNSGTLTYSGTGDVRNTAESSGYSGASAGGNIFLTNSSTASFTIGNINTSGFDSSSLTLAFGAFKSITASNLTELQVAYSTGGAFTNLNFAAQPTGTGTAIWRNVVITDANLIPTSSTLTLRWTNSSATPQFRIDDILLQGTITAVPEPTSIALVSLVGCAAFVASCRRRKTKSKKV